ncbi:MAG: helix-turn-helix domain-containing protein, partial [Salibacteraceae bacterium]|nr:helix-turn-helix domain-containing protein [Salibacteraceae bacterium]
MKAIQFLQTSPEELKREILRELIPIIKSIQEDLKSPKREQYLTISDVCDLLSISRSTLNSWTKSGKLMSCGISGRVYYKMSEIESSMIPLNSSPLKSAA